MVKRRVKINGPIAMMIILVVGLGSVRVSGAGEPRGLSAGPLLTVLEEKILVVGAQAVGDDAPSGEHSEGGDLRARDQEKKRYKMALLLLGAAVAILFGFLLLLALIRSHRFYRRRLHVGDKAQPTEYFDAWGGYRLKEQDEKDKNPDDGKDG